MVEITLQVKPDYTVAIRRKGRSVDTLLSAFMNEKMVNHEEPQRKGTPKGEEVGFSKVKYLAALLMITSLKEKTIAAELDISVGSLRNWNTQEKFKNEVAGHCKEFAGDLIEFVNEKGGIYLKKLVTSERGEKKSSTMKLSGLDDSRIYGHCVADHVLDLTINRLGSQFTKAYKDPSEKEATKIHNALFLLSLMAGYLFAPEEYPELIKRADRFIDADNMAKVAILDLLDIADIIMSRTIISKRDKKHVATIHAAIKNYVQFIGLF